MRIVSLRHKPLFVTEHTDYIKAACFLFSTKKKGITFINAGEIYNHICF